MATAKSNYNIVGATDKVKVVYEQRQILHGLIKWWKKVSEKKLNEITLIVEMDEEPKVVIINGYEYQKLT